MILIAENFSLTVAILVWMVLALSWGAITLVSMTADVLAILQEDESSNSTESTRDNLK